jgi:putative oxidoreductase
MKMTSWNLRENTMAMTAFNWIGRALLALLFILAGVGKITGYDKTLAYMATQGVPGFLLPAVIALELGGGLALLIGWRADIAAVLLAGFSIIAAVVFHRNFADQAQLTLFLKDFAIAGGLLFAVLAQSRTAK